MQSFLEVLAMTQPCFKVLAIAWFCHIINSEAYNASDLRTSRQWIVDKRSGTRVRFKCLNWYGAHQEPGVVGGLEHQTIDHLVDLLEETGANCVRITVAISTTKENPIILPNFISGMNTEGPVRALDVMDKTIHTLHRRGLMVILNNHVSWPAWVGGMDSSQQGLWGMPQYNYSTQDWLDSLRTLAARYKGQIIGIDLRNEIHDQDGTYITWGQTSNEDSDWLVASTSASEVLHQVDPELFIFVGGLCWNFDLRDMMSIIGPRDAYNRGKLVYTVHVYPFSFFWRSKEIISSISSIKYVCFLLFILCSSLCLTSETAAYQKLHPGSMWHSIEAFWYAIDWQYVFISSLALTVPLCICLHIAADLARASKCACISNTFAPYLVCLIVAIALCIGWAIYLLWHKRLNLKRALKPGLVWMSIATLSSFFWAKFLLSTDSMDAVMNMWSLENRDVPVWVGEFGTSDPQSKEWVWLWDFIKHRHDLDYAYWAFNGKKWQTDKWTLEPFGLVDSTYAKLTRNCFAETLFR